METNTLLRDCNILKHIHLFFLVLPLYTHIYIYSFLWQIWERQLADFGHAEHAAMHTVQDPDKFLQHNQVFEFGEQTVRCLQYVYFGVFSLFQPFLFMNVVIQYRLCSYYNYNQKWSFRFLLLH